MTAEQTPAAWKTKAWREEATTWLDSVLAELGVSRTAPVRQPHLEPWSTVLSTETSSGRVWLKAMIPATAFEIDLYDLLARIAPESVLHPLASDVRRGWLLLPDGGPSVAERFDGQDLITATVAALPQYASLQRATAPKAELLIQTGLSDCRPDHLLGRFRDALARHDGAPFSNRLATLEGQ